MGKKLQWKSLEKRRDNINKALGEYGMGPVSTRTEFAQPWGGDLGAAGSPQDVSHGVHGTAWDYKTSLQTDKNIKPIKEKIIYSTKKMPMR
jgi:hypothetical protein